MESPMSREELGELLTTRYVPHFEMDLDQLETVRAGSSVPQLRDAEIIEGNERVNDVLLEDHPSRVIINETPKLTVKRALAPIRDEAVQILRELRNSPAEEIRRKRLDCSLQKWVHTSRNSEIELMEYVLLFPNHRPHYFTMRSTCLEVADISRLILTSLIASPKENGQCLAQFTIKPQIEVPFLVLFGIMESLQEQEKVQLTDCVVTATIINQDGGKMSTNRLITTNCKEYGELEPELEDQGMLIASMVTFTCSVQGQKHVQTKVSYWNNANVRPAKTRNRFIVLEQTVKCVNRSHSQVIESEELSNV